MVLETPRNMLVKCYASETFLRSKEAKRAEFLEPEPVSDSVLKAMADTQSPQGLLAVIRQPKYSLEETLKRDGLYLLLEDINDPGNLGTMMRTGEGAGIAGLIMTRNTVDIFNPKVIRSTMGGIFRVPFVVVNEAEDAAEALRKVGIGLYAAHLRGNDYDKGFDFRRGTCFMIGNEARGLKETTAALADGMVKIPMEGSVESLNAGVSAGILLYEAYRQRRM